jgi:uncharacterized membrane protein
MARPGKLGLCLRTLSPSRPGCKAYDRTIAIDVSTEVVIKRPRDQVAAFASDPDNVHRWYANIKSVQWRTPRPLAVGTQLDFVAEFLRRRIAYTYEVKEFVPGERFVMATADGPFPMETTYEWRDAPAGITSMTVRNRGEPRGFQGFASPVLAAAVRRANRKDLAKLKQLLESEG